MGRSPERSESMGWGEGTRLSGIPSYRSLRRWGEAPYLLRFAGHAKRSESLGWGEGACAGKMVRPASRNQEN